MSEVEQLAEYESQDLKKVLSLPNGVFVSHTIANSTPERCKVACLTDAKCTGFQFVTIENVCKILAKADKVEATVPVSAVQKMIDDAVSAEKAKMEREQRAVSSSAVAESVPEPEDSEEKTAEDIFREAQALFEKFQQRSKRAEAESNEANQKAQGGINVDSIVKKNEQTQMKNELAAAKKAQAAGLNFEEVSIMASSPDDEKVILAKNFKEAAMADEKVKNKKYEESKVIMTKGMELSQRLSANAITANTKLGQAKIKEDEAKSKFEAAQEAYKGHEIKEKDLADEKAKKQGAKELKYLKQQDKKAERQVKDNEVKLAGDAEVILAKCRASQVKMRKLRNSVLGKIKADELKTQDEKATAQIASMRDGMRSALKREAEGYEAQLLSRATSQFPPITQVADQEAADTEALKAAESKRAVATAISNRDTKNDETAAARVVLAGITKKVSSAEIELVKTPKSTEVADRVAQLKASLRAAENTETTLSAALTAAEAKLKQANAKAAADESKANAAKDKVVATLAKKTRNDIALAEAIAKAKQEAASNLAKKNRDLIAEMDKKAADIRERAQNRAREIWSSKWEKAKKKLKLDIVRCDTRPQSAVEKLKMELASVKTMAAQAEAERIKKVLDAKAAKVAKDAALEIARKEMASTLKGFEEKATKKFEAEVKKVESRAAASIKDAATKVEANNLAMREVKAQAQKTVAMAEKREKASAKSANEAQLEAQKQTAAAKVDRASSPTQVLHGVQKEKGRTGGK